MTRDEIRLILFVLIALSVGTAVQWWHRSRPAQPLPPPTVAEPKKGWAKPPYVFKSRAEMDRLKESLEADRPQ